MLTAKRKMKIQKRRKTFLEINILPRRDFTTLMRLVFFGTLKLANVFWGIKSAQKRNLKVLA